MTTSVRWALSATVVLVCGAAACRRPPVESSRPEAGDPGSRTGASPDPAAQRPAETTPSVGVSPVAEQLTDAFAAAAQAIRASVVRVEVEMTSGGRARARQFSELPNLPESFRRFFDFGNEGSGAPDLQPSIRRQAVGSGIVLDVAGHVITNAHVVDRASKVTVQLPDNRKLPAKVVGKDRLTDIAVLAIENPPKQLTVARIGDSTQLRVGQWVLAVGSPLGLDQSVTAGIVSGLGQTSGRVRMSGERVRRYIQTDASINPGNSGGPLVTLAADVVGVNTLIDVGPGGAYGFAIPIQEAAAVARTLVKDGRVRYPYLGVEVISLEDLPADARARLRKPPERGAFVSGVVAGGPAARAGVQAGDVIVKIGSVTVDDARDLVEAVSSQSIGAKIPIEVWHEGQRRTTEVTVRELPSDPEAVVASEVRIGVGVQNLTEALAQQLGLPPDTKGALVTDVQAGSPAAAAGLAPGDVIVQVDRKPVRSAEELAKAIREGGDKAHLLLVRTASGVRLVPVNPTS